MSIVFNFLIWKNNCETHIYTNKFVQKGGIDMNYKMEFPFAVMTATISFIAFIFLAVSPDIATNAIFYILPCLLDSLKALCMDKSKLSKGVICLNFIALALSVSCISICMIALMKGLHLDWVIIIICAAYPVKCIGYVKFLWRNFD